MLRLRSNAVHRFSILPRGEALEDRRLLAYGVLQETGEFSTEVERLKQLAFEKDSNAYVAPSSTELSEFAALASNLRSGNLETVVSQAQALDYELVEFTDSASNTVVYGLREKLIDGSPTRGWGSYFINFAHHADALVEVPQPLFDINTWDVGGKVFLNAKARGFLMAGAHRNANGPGSADVAHLSESVFQTVHEVWNGPLGDTTAWQIHGFSLANHDGDPGEDLFPAGTDLVSSGGDGAVSSEMIDLDTSFSAQGFAGYTYNTLDPSDPINVQVNDGVDGTTFASLASTTNVQGIHSRSLGGTFVHAELEQSIRFDAGNRQIAANLISDTMSTPPAFFVTGSELDVASLQLTVDFGEAFDSTTLSAEDLTVDGTAAIAVQPIDSDTVLFDLPPLAAGSHSASIAADTIGSASQIGLNEFQLFFEISEPEPAALGTKFFVVDTAGDSTFEYDADGALVESYGLASGNTMPRGAASDATGETVWVIDDDDHVYVYDGDGGFLGDWFANGLSRPEGIATDGEHVWIVDRGTDRVYFFQGAAAHRSGSYDAFSSFGLASGNKNPRGLTTDGDHLWVVHWSTSSSDKVFKYSVTGTLAGSWQIDADNDSPRGITIDPHNPSNLWIVDNVADSIFQYLGAGERTSGSQDADAVFALLGTNPQGISDPLAVADSTQDADTSASDDPVTIASGQVRTIVDEVDCEHEEIRVEDDDRENDDEEDDDLNDFDDKRRGRIPRLHNKRT